MRRLLFDIVNLPRQPVELNRVITTSVSVSGTGKSAISVQDSIELAYCISINVLVNFHLSTWLFLLISLEKTINNIEIESRSLILNSLLHYHENSESESHTKTYSLEMEIKTLLIYKYLNVTLEIRHTELLKSYISITILAILLLASVVVIDQALLAHSSSC